MNTTPILKNKIFLYLTEFFAGMSVMAVELGASLDCGDSGGWKVYCAGNFSAAHFYGEYQLPDLGSVCGLHGNLCVSAVSAGNGDAFFGKVYGAEP